MHGLHVKPGELWLPLPRQMPLAYPYSAGRSNTQQGSVHTYVLIKILTVIHSLSRIRYPRSILLAHWPFLLAFYRLSIGFSSTGRMTPDGLVSPIFCCICVKPY